MESGYLISYIEETKSCKVLFLKYKMRLIFNVTGIDIIYINKYTVI